MPNPRGRPRLERTVIMARVAPETPSALRREAIKLGFIHGKGAALGKLLDAWAGGEFVLIRREYLEKLSIK
ncbi:MAG: hypothetical protein KME19_10605 [Microcoleus vaginatus WJT46-NPBG5]|nr:hypothetical protein [Microcoleus vaginatus WJT46-NPBG5]